jgi:hypothetical protein
MRGLLVMAMFTASLAGAGTAGVPHSQSSTELAPDPNIERRLGSHETPQDGLHERDRLTAISRTADPDWLKPC